MNRLKGRQRDTHKKQKPSNKKLNLQSAVENRAENTLHQLGEKSSE